MDAQHDHPIALLDQLGAAGIAASVRDQEILIERAAGDEIIVETVPAVEPDPRRRFDRQIGSRVDAAVGAHVVDLHLGRRTRGIVGVHDTLLRQVDGVQMDGEGVHRLWKVRSTSRQPQESCAAR